MGSTTKIFKEFFDQENKKRKEMALAIDKTIESLQRIERVAVAAVCSSDPSAKQNYLWEILREFDITPDDLTNAIPPTYWGNNEKEKP